MINFNDSRIFRGIVFLYFHFVVFCWFKAMELLGADYCFTLFKFVLQKFPLFWISSSGTQWTFDFFKVRVEIADWYTYYLPCIIWKLWNSISQATNTSEFNPLQPYDVRQPFGRSLDWSKFIYKAIFLYNWGKSHFSSFFGYWDPKSPKPSPKLLLL